MAIIEDQAHCVVTDRLNCAYADIFFTDLQRFLPGAMAFYLRTWRMHPQILTTELELTTIIETHYEQLRILLKTNFCRCWHLV